MKLWLFLTLFGLCYLLIEGAEEKKEESEDKEEADDGEEEEEDEDEDGEGEGDKKEDDDGRIVLSPDKGTSKEWGTQMGWLEDLDEGLEVAKKENKPVMMVVHRVWCHACKNLAQKVKVSKGIEALSKHFIMVSVSGDQEPWQEEYNPDGSYVPRTHFIEPNGKLIPDITNMSDQYEKVKYFFPTTKDIVIAMKTALKRLGAVENVDAIADENKEGDAVEQRDVLEKREL